MITEINLLHALQQRGLVGHSIAVNSLAGHGDPVVRHERPLRHSRGAAYRGNLDDARESPRPNI